MIAVLEKIWTVEEYFKLEETSEVRHEFVHGKLIRMPGESKNANTIAINFCMQLMPLRNKGFEIFMLDVRLQVEKRGIYRYPDLVVAHETDDKNDIMVTQPVVIVEVLSKSTARTDRGDKLREYTNLPTLQYYFLVSQKKQLVEVYSLKNGEWVFQFFDQKNPLIQLPKLELTFSIESLYKSVRF